MLHRRLSWSLFILTILPIQAANFTSLYFFGDSLSDTGNVFTATSIFSQLTLGLIPVQPESPPYYQGRFSNGPVWTETVAALRGMPQTSAPAGMSLGLFGSLPGTGNNYAIGGARTGFGGALGPLDSLIPTGVFAQTNFYLSQHAGTADPEALYLISGGGNDLRDASLIADAAARRLAAEQAATSPPTRSSTSTEPARATFCS